MRRKLSRLCQELSQLCSKIAILNRETVVIDVIRAIVRSGVSTVYRNMLENHSADHVYSCRVCFKEFISSTMLERHTANKHKATNKHKENDNQKLTDRHKVKDKHEADEKHKSKEEPVDSLSSPGILERHKANTHITDVENDQINFPFVNERKKVNKPTHNEGSAGKLSKHYNNIQTPRTNTYTTEQGEINTLPFPFSLRRYDENEKPAKEKHIETLSSSHITEKHNDNTIADNETVGEFISCLNVEKGEKVKGKNNYCDMCGQSFRCKNDKWIKEHYHEQHDIVKLFYCLLCGYGFSFSTGLSKHLKYVHKVAGEIQKLRCDLCNKTYTATCNLKEHMLVHIGKVKTTITTCAVCEEVFNNRSALRRHKRLHLSESEREAYIHSCSFCKKTFSARYRLNEHVANMHTGEKNHVCSVCGKRYYLSYELKRHMYVHTGECVDKYTCQVCDAKFTRSYTLNRHLKRHADFGNRFECMVCNKSFSRLWTLQRHTMTHDGTEPFLCSLCGDKFIFKVQLTEHMLDKHCTHLNLYKCHLCGREYNTQRKLNLHLKQHNKPVSEGASLSHNRRPSGRQNKSCVCETCGMVTKNGTTMEAHRRTHSNERPYNCPVCSKGFTQLSVMLTHLKIHTGDNFHSCTLCNKYYTRAIDLEYHLRGKIHARQIRLKAKRSH